MLPKQDLKGLKNFNKREYSVKVQMRRRAEYSNVTSFDFKTLKKKAALSKLFLQCSNKMSVEFALIFSHWSDGTCLNRRSR